MPTTPVRRGTIQSYGLARLRPVAVVGGAGRGGHVGRFRFALLDGRLGGVAADQEVLDDADEAGGHPVDKEAAGNLRSTMPKMRGRKRMILFCSGAVFMAISWETTMVAM